MIAKRKKWLVFLSLAAAVLLAVFLVGVLQSGSLGLAEKEHTVIFWIGQDPSTNAYWCLPCRNLENDSQFRRLIGQCFSHKNCRVTKVFAKHNGQGYVKTDRAENKFFGMVNWAVPSIQIDNGRIQTGAAAITAALQNLITQLTQEAQPSQPPPSSHLQKLSKFRELYDQALNQLRQVRKDGYADNSSLVIELKKLIELLKEKIKKECESAAAVTPKPALEVLILTRDQVLNLPHSSPLNIQLARDLNSHEKKHGEMALVTQNFMNGQGRGIFVGFSKDGKLMFFQMRRPKGTINGLQRSGAIPAFFQNYSRYQTYIINAQQSWQELTYLYDEWGAYIGGGLVRLTLRKAGQRHDGDGSDLSLANIIEGPMDFLVIGTAAALYLRQNDPAYFNSLQYQLFLKRMIEQTMALIKDAVAAYGWEDSGHAADVLRQLRNSSNAAPLRQMFKQLYGAQWTQQVLGF